MNWTWPEIVFGVGTLVFLVLNVYDVTTTNKGLKRGAVELGALSGWFQRTFGRWWWIPRILAALLLWGFDLWIFFSSAVIGIAVVMFSCILLWSTVSSNEDVAGDLK
jgi:hypothetical protein